MIQFKAKQKLFDCKQIFQQNKIEFVTKLTISSDLISRRFNKKHDFQSFFDPGLVFIGLLQLFLTFSNYCQGQTWAQILKYLKYKYLSRKYISNTKYK